MLFSVIALVVSNVIFLILAIVSNRDSNQTWALYETATKENEILYKLNFKKDEKIERLEDDIEFREYLESTGR